MTQADKKRLDMTAQLFKAVGHPDRLAMLEHLGERPWCVCELAAKLNLNKSVASKHLSLLYTTGVVDMERTGTQVRYSLIAPCVIEMGKCSYLAVHQELSKRLR